MKSISLVAICSTLLCVNAASTGFVPHRPSTGLTSTPVVDEKFDFDAAGKGAHCKPPKQEFVHKETYPDGATCRFLKGAPNAECKTLRVTWNMMMNVMEYGTDDLINKCGLQPDGHAFCTRARHISCPIEGTDYIPIVVLVTSTYEDHRVLHDSGHGKQPVCERQFSYKPHVHARITHPNGQPEEVICGA